MLQGRLLFYGDAQRYRLGVNPHLIPANKARCPFHSHHRDGAMRGDGNHGSTLGCEPNSYREWRQQPGFAEPRLALEGAADKKKLPFENTALALGDRPMDVKLRHLCDCCKADPAYAVGVATALKIAWKVPK
jgi:catalase